jgi:hypothetical protein
MSREEVSRRDFHRLSTAALCGLIAGTTFGCAQEGNGHAPKSAGSVDTSPAHATTATTASKSTAGKATVTVVALHACRGLNECKGLGKSAKNDCAGQGDCYTVKHDCAGQNDCKYQGGCGGENGMNDCKTKGGCGHFPIAEADVWKKARAAFEARLKSANKKFGLAPAAKS